MRPLLRIATNPLRSQVPSLAALLSTIMSGATNSPPAPQESTITPLPRSTYPTPLAINPSDLRRADESPDAQFYASPRFVQHIDEACISRLEAYYSGVIAAAASSVPPRGGSDGRPAGRVRILDLCSSWTSHLPPSLLPAPAQGSSHQPGTEHEASGSGHREGQGPVSHQVEACIIGVGMNEAELSANKHLTRHIVRDLNATPTLPEIESSSMDVVICSVSIDYLTRPVEVLGEVRRVLRDGGTMHAGFSNRCFPTKVVGRWMRMSDLQRRRWVGGYFWACNELVGGDGGAWVDVEEVVFQEDGYGDPLFVVRARKIAGGGDEAGAAMPKLL